jgi:hypothetical protein
MGQMVMVLIPISYLLVGPLADQVFEPAVGTPGWQTVAPLVGDGAGSGYGLLMLIAGAVLVVTTAIVYAIPRVRHMEAELPDYAPTPVAADATPAVSAAAATD